MSRVRSAIGWAESTLEFSDAEVGGALGASSRSVSRWRDELHRPTDRHVLAAERILKLALALDTAFAQDLERLHHWLHEPVPELDRRTPLRAIADGKIDEVHTVLANVDTGV